MSKNKIFWGEENMPNSLWLAKAHSDRPSWDEFEQSEIQFNNLNSGNILLNIFNCKCTFVNVT